MDGEVIAAWVGALGTVAALAWAISERRRTRPRLKVQWAYGLFVENASFVGTSLGVRITNLSDFAVKVTSLCITDSKATGPEGEMDLSTWTPVAYPITVDPKSHSKVLVGMYEDISWVPTPTNDDELSMLASLGGSISRRVRRNNDVLSYGARGARGFRIVAVAETGHRFRSVPAVFRPESIRHLRPWHRLVLRDRPPRFV
jgi:hypothetical protein